MGRMRGGRERLLDVLAAGAARASFFPIASRAAAYPELVARMRSEGHQIGLHCDRRVRHSACTEAWLGADTERALERLASVGVAPTRWRTPWGDVARFTRAVARAHGLAVIGWTVDTHDWRGDSATTMFATTRDRLTDTAIVLAHDGIGGAFSHLPIGRIGHDQAGKGADIELLLNRKRPGGDQFPGPGPDNGGAENVAFWSVMTLMWPLVASVAKARSFSR